MHLSLTRTRATRRHFGIRGCGTKGPWLAGTFADTPLVRLLLISPLALSDGLRFHATPKSTSIPRKLVVGIARGVREPRAVAGRLISCVAGIAKIGSSPAASKRQSSVKPGNVTSITVRQHRIEKSRQNQRQSGGPFVKCAEPLRLAGENQVVGFSIDEASGRRL